MLQAVTVRPNTEVGGGTLVDIIIVTATVGRMAVLTVTAVVLT